MKAFSDYLKKAFNAIKVKKRIMIILIILIILGVTYSAYLKSFFFLLISIAAGGISKIYHRFFKSSAGIDLVFFTTIMISLVYRNLFFSLANAWIGLIIADNIGHKFSYTSIVSLFGLTLIAIVARFLPFPILISALLLTILFEIFSIVAYNLLGSSFDKILVYLVTHFTFNLFLIFGFAQSLASIMI